MINDPWLICLASGFIGVFGLAVVVKAAAGVMYLLERYGVVK